MEYKLYAKLENNIIIDLKMSWQQNDFTDYTEILETDNRHKANDYNLMNINGDYILKYENGEIVENTVADSVILERFKNSRLSELTTNQKILIENGFTYNSVHYGSSEIDQLNWSSLIGVINLGLVTFPYSGVKDWDGNYITFNTIDDLRPVIGAYLTHIETYRASYKVIKDSIDNSTTIEELNNIIDDRE